MGNDPSQHFKADKSAMYIRTDQPYYFAGDTVTGNIYVNIAGGYFPSAQVDLKVKGSEKCEWEEHETVWETIPGTDPPQQQSKVVIHKYDGENDFYKNKIPVHAFQQQQIPGGQYVFPFSFTLKHDLPGTYHKKLHQAEAKIKYKIKGEIEAHDKNFHKLKYNQEIIVREPVKNQVQSLQGSIVTTPNSFCCIPKGTFSMKGTFDKNTYLPGETAYIWVDIDNSRCDLDVTSINATLRNTLTLHGKHGKSKVISTTVASSSIPGVGAGQSFIDENRKTLTMQLTDNHNTQPLEPTTNGKIVKCNYTISCNAQLDGCCMCSSDPGVSFNAMIAAPQLNTYAFQLPQLQGWNPQVFAPCNVQFDDSTRYQPATGGHHVQQMPQQGGYNNQQYANPNQQYY